MYFKHFKIESFQRGNQCIRRHTDVLVPSASILGGALTCHHQKGTHIVLQKAAQVAGVNQRATLN